jgi:hypothetical protein
LKRSFRSKIFVYQGDDGNQYSIGPAIVFESLLKVFDRMIDRRRATCRTQMVEENMRDIDDFESAAAYLEAAMLSFQNLSQDERASIGEVIEQYRVKDWPPKLKIMAAGFALLTIGGEANFRLLVKNMKAYLKEPAAAPGPPRSS